MKGLDKGPRPATPAQAWAALAAGNERFVGGRPDHPNQDAQHRGELVGGQNPFAAFFGCSDSRVAAEVVFDQGLGDLFVVRTAGHVIDPSVLGSLEFGVSVLKIPLIVTLGHDSCGAVKATIGAIEDGTMPTGFVRDIVERVVASVLAARNVGPATPEAVEAVHVKQTMELMKERSTVIRDGVAAGRLGLIGLTYALSDGRAKIVHAIGDVGVESPGTPA
ncbi:MAG: carbonic anhydrase [Austwickia sp.]|nr:carbonic anhydrase [Austwickia sp.]MBK8436031.1 carbonic anhydrase [Austwickia sp.]